MIASLPMYDTPDTAQANDRLWALIRDALGNAPEKLDRVEDPFLTWQRPDLVLSQTCGLPYRARLWGNVILVGTPDYGVPGCAPGYYRSCLIVRADDPRDTISEFERATFARNSVMSQSGWAAMDGYLSEKNLFFDFFGRILDTGSHARSAREVATKGADIAALDAVTWSLLERVDPITQRLRVMDVTRPTPGLPFICAPSADVDRLRAAITSAIEMLSQSDRDALHLKSMVQIPRSAYLSEKLPKGLVAQSGII